MGCVRAHRTRATSECPNTNGKHDRTMANTTSKRFILSHCSRPKSPSQTCDKFIIAWGCLLVVRYCICIQGRLLEKRKNFATSVFRGTSLPLSLHSKGGGRQRMMVALRKSCHDGQSPIRLQYDRTCLVVESLKLRYALFVCV